VIGAALAAVVVAAELTPAPTAVRHLTMDDCVREALVHSGQVIEAKGKVREWEGRLKEVESTYWPKLIGLTYVAPLYGVKAVQSPSYQQIPISYQRDLTSWGPYIKLQGILAEPIGTFGRYDAGKEAASERMAVEQARYEQTRNTLALEVRKYYLLHLYARSFLPSLDLANRLVKEAQDKAKEEFDTGSGSVTQVDLNKLRFGYIELQKAKVQANIGEKLALAALKHTMGLPQDAPVETVEAALPPMPTDPLDPLQAYIARAKEHRPEMAQLYHGEKASKAFELTERLSSMPTAFVALQIDLNWSPMWPAQDNPFAWDRFNTITPGAAIGLQFDIDVAKSLARSYGAKGLIAQVDGL
jgi:outer membrane protein TolC